MYDFWQQTLWLLIDEPLASTITTTGIMDTLQQCYCPIDVSLALDHSITAAKQ
jgi:hypothetical protein